MSTFKLERTWSGYSRGTDYREVEADSAEEALQIAEDDWDNTGVREIVRDDTETDDWGIV